MCVASIFGAPGPGRELEIAGKILASKAGLEYQILDALVGEPKTYGALKPLVTGMSDTNLTRALKRLRSWGAIDIRLDLSNKTREYRLTALGKLLYARIQQMRPMHEGVEAYKVAVGA